MVCGQFRRFVKWFGLFISCDGNLTVIRIQYNIIEYGIICIFTQCCKLLAALVKNNFKNPETCIKIYSKYILNTQNKHAVCYTIECYLQEYKQK